ncbi:MAG: DNA polymerase I [Deltaproteobacteria bacterium]|nr:DNA polymerase I [Deltaproteobacteria bacterium]
MTTAKKIYLIDGSSLIYRAYHALPPLTTSSGQPTNAVYGFANMILKLLADEQPEHVVVVMDAKGPTWRHRLYPAYKATRPPMPPDLVQQLPYFRRLLEALRIPVLVRENYEADDLIATLTRQARAAGYQVVIVSGDKDLMSLVGDGVVMVDTLKEKTYTPEEVAARHGVTGERLLDMLALAGDKSDNVPGVPGIGPKSAVKLLQEYGSLDNILTRADDIKRTGWREKITANREQARLSRTLVTMDDRVPLEFDPQTLRRGEADKEKLQALLHELEFYSLAKKLVGQKPISREGYRLVLDRELLTEIAARLRQAGSFAIDTETTARQPMAAQLVGISLCCDADEAWYIPVAHRETGEAVQLDLAVVKEILGPVLAEAGIGKWGHNIKYDYIVLEEAGLPLAGIEFDTMVASYVLNPGRHSHSLAAVAQEILQHTPTEFKDVVGRGRQAVTFDQVDLDTARDYACEDAHLTFLLQRELAPRLAAAGLESLFQDLEMPLVLVLARMEMAGVKIDSDLLQSLSREYEAKLAAMEVEIHSLAGVEFNINSPKQLAAVLFERLNLPVLKKTKTGPSTNVEVLNELAAHHPLPAKILAYRSLAKLKSTYLDALPKLVNPKTGRVHTSYNQTVAATGRLSSSDPNLQNIPIRGEDGANIRRAFIAEGENLLLSADYSQVELRILAHLSGDPELLKAFERGDDIHALTAARIFNVLPLMVTDAMRREAKVVNFGVLYGMSPFGLARELHIDRETAKAYIDNYFATYRRVKDYFAGLVAAAEKKGYVETMLGRRRYLPEIRSRNPHQREMARRMAVNSPIQGSAADLIKLAMIRLDEQLRREGWQARMIMQVHDELVFEVPPAEAEPLREIVRRQMTGVVELRVPLVVEIGVGRNWLEAH